MTCPHSWHSRWTSSSSWRHASAAMVPRIGRKKPTANHSTNELPFQRPINAAERPQKKQMTTRPRPLIGLRLENADGPDDGEHRDYYDDHSGERRHDPDHNLEQDPRG